LNKDNLRVSFDIDDTLAGFWEAYIKMFPGDKNLIDSVITKNVNTLRHNKEFWESLSVIDRPNFEPYNYCTKRVNCKSYTRNWLANNGFPIKPIYQVYYQKSNKADYIKGRCDVLIDDSISNVQNAIKSGLPALLIDRPHNQNGDPVFRIYSLDIEEIVWAYNLELETLQWI
jgi:5'(3')-deoxyribonucleotidase